MPTTQLRAFRPHISLDVNNLAASVKFYSSLFGEGPSKERQGYAKFELQHPPLNFSMNEREHCSCGSLSHLGFEVLSTEEVRNAKARLESEGILTREELATTCCYAKQDKVWVSDPDGNAWEIFVVTEKDTKTARDADGIIACCVPQELGMNRAACC